MPENEISTEYVPDDDDAQSYVEFLEQEMTRVKEKLKYSIPGTEEYLNASQAFEKITAAYRNLYDHYYSEESETADIREEHREKNPSFYAEKAANKRKERLMAKERKEMMAQLKEQMKKKIALMDQCQCGSDEYNKLEEERRELAREYYDLSKLSSDEKERFWDKVKWGVNAGVALLGIFVPPLFFGHFFHQGLDFESTGAYRSRGVSNLVNKMVPKELQF